MHRKAVKIAQSDDKRRAIYIDAVNYREIFSYLVQDQRHVEKFRFITGIILSGLRNPEVYDKEDYNKRTKGVTAMKFFKGQENDRIYCRELTRDDKTFVVVAAELLQRKKSSRLSHKEINLIDKVAGYDYELED